MPLRRIVLLCVSVLLAGCGPDKAELQRRSEALGDPCIFLLEAGPEEVFQLSSSEEIEQHEVPRADGSNHFGCVLTWNGRAGSVVLGLDLYMFSGRGPEPGARVDQLLEEGEFRAAQHFAYDPVAGVGERAAYNQRLNMLAWRHRGHLFYLNATDTSLSDKQAIARFAIRLNENWPGG